MNFLNSAIGSKHHFPVAAFLSLVLLSCIKNAPLNPEADIEAFIIDPALKTSPTTIDLINNKVQLYLTADAFGKGIAPLIQLSRGATITPASGDSIHPQSGPVRKRKGRVFQ